jgi:acetolactate synthase small subunit
MFNIVRFTRRTCPALALTLALTSCDSSTNEALTSFLTGNSSQEHQQLQAQLQQMKNALAQTEQEISQAESHDARVNYNLQKRLSNPGRITTPFTVKDIDVLPSTCALTLKTCAKRWRSASRNSMPCNINITRMRPNWLNSNKPTR